MRNLPRKYLLIGAAVAVLAAVILGVVLVRSEQAAEDARWQKATESFANADYETAAREIGGEELPDDPERLRVYSQSMLATRQLDKALAGYQKLYAINKDPGVQLLIGNVYNEQKKYDEAIEIYKEAIATNPANTQAYVNLATLYKLQGNTAEAIRIADDAVKNNPGSVTLHQLRISMLLEEKGSDRYKAAVAGLRAVSPDDPLLRSLNE